MSSNANRTLAKAGDVISVMINTSEPVTVPSVTCNGITFTVAGSSGQTNYVATHTVNANDPNVVFGVCDISYSDLAGNVGTATKNASSLCNVTIGECAVSILAHSD